MTTQQMLEEAIIHFGPGDIRTLKLSEQRDKEIVEEQKQLYKLYKEGNNELSVCN